MNIPGYSRGGETFGVKYENAFSIRFCLAALLCLGLLHALLPAAPDILLLGPHGGDVRSLAIHPLRPERVFLGTSDGQIFFSVDSGDSWTRLEPGLNRRDLVVDNFAFHPSDPDLLYAASWELRRNHGWLARSRDGGATWETLPTGELNSQIRAIAIAPSEPNVIAIGVSEGVLLSVDSGRSWRNVTRGYRGLLNIESLAFDPTDSRVLYAGTWRLGWKSADQGQSWKAIHEGMHFDSDMFSIVINPLEPETLFASACTGVYKSVNGGRRWRKLRSGIPKEANRTRTLHLDPSDPNRIYAGTIEGLYVSGDAGENWTHLVPDVVVNSIAVSPADSRSILVGTDDAGVLKSVDGGKSFAPANRGFIHRQVGALALDPEHPGLILAGLAQDGSHGGFFVSRDQGASWRAYNEGLGAAAASIRAILQSRRSERVYLATAGGVFAGVPFRQPWTKLPGTGQWAVNALSFESASEARLLVGTDRGLYRLEAASETASPVALAGDAGAVWHLLGRGGSDYLVSTDAGLFRLEAAGRSERLGRGLPPGRVNFVKASGPALLAGTRQGLFVSRDGGAVWTRCADVFPLDVSDLGANPADPSHLVATDSTGGFLFESRDGGSSWRSFTRDNRSRIHRLGFTAAGDLLAATLSEGIYLLQMPVRSGD